MSWRQIKLIEAAEINPGIPRGLVPEPSELVAFLPMAAVGEDGSVETSEARPYADVSKGYTVFCRGDVLLAKITPCMENGKAALVNSSSTKVACGSTEFHVLRAREGIDPRYLFHLIWNEPFRRLAARNMTGSAGQKRVPKSFLETHSIPLPHKNGKPDLDEQKRIAAILDKADAIRRKRQQALRLTDDFLRSVFLDMFGDPVTNPKGWDVVELGDFSDQLTGFAFKSSNYVPAGSGIRLCRGANVLPDTIDWSDQVDWPDANDPVLQRYRLQKGDVIIALDRPWISSGFKIARISERDLPALLVQRVARIRAKAPLTNDFLYYLIGTEAFARHCKPTETTIPHISPRELRSFPVIVPPPKAIEAFTSLQTVIAAKRARMMRTEVESEDLFTSLQQRAFRGEL